MLTVGMDTLSPGEQIALSRRALQSPAVCTMTEKRFGMAVPAHGMAVEAAMDAADLYRQSYDSVCVSRGLRAAAKVFHCPVQDMIHMDPDKIAELLEPLNDQAYINALDSLRLYHLACFPDETTRTPKWDRLTRQAPPPVVVQNTVLPRVKITYQ